ncbi:hypothetical protein R2362_16035 [Mycobacteroides chelonae]|nr:hypothetical protein [Mycobacteroides chelonae]
MSALPESFTVSYDTWAGVTDRQTDPDNEPDIRPVTGTILFRYRVPSGWAFRAAEYDPRPTDFALDTFTARLDEGRLKQLDGTVNVKLIANTPSWRGTSRCTSTSASPTSCSTAVTGHGGTSPSSPPPPVVGRST